MQFRSRQGDEKNARGLWHVDFTSALENKTGKYFMGRDIIENNLDKISCIHFWRRKTGLNLDPEIKSYLRFGFKVELRLGSALGLAPIPTVGKQERCLHIDPHSVLHAGLRSQDIVMCHDLGPITHPELYNRWVPHLYRHAYKAIQRKRPRAVFISQHTQREFCKLFGALPDMSVIYPPIRSAVKSTEIRPLTGVQQPFILTVGSLGRRKNQIRTINAYARSNLFEKGISYVLCGAREIGFEAVEQAAKETPGVHIFNYVADPELNWLYKNAAGFVLVSNLEGFGVPVAEAISHGLVPIITSDSVLDEVAGSSALGVASQDVEGMSRAMVRVVNMDIVEKQARIAQMQSSLERFSSETYNKSWSDLLSR